MQFGDRLTSTASDGNGFVPSTDTGILMELNHSDSNGKRSLCDNAGNRTPNPRYRDRLNCIIWIVLLRTVMRNGRQLRFGHPTMQTKPHHYGTGHGHALPKRIER